MQICRQTTGCHGRERLGEDCGWAGKRQSGAWVSLLLCPSVLPPPRSNPRSPLGSTLIDPSPLGSTLGHLRRRLGAAPQSPPTVPWASFEGQSRATDWRRGFGSLYFPSHARQRGSERRAVVWAGWEAEEQSRATDWRRRAFGEREKRTFLIETPKKQRDSNRGAEQITHCDNHKPSTTHSPKRKARKEQKESDALRQ